MNSFTLRVNVNHLKREIEKDYLFMRNHYCICVVAGICSMRFAGRLAVTPEFEDSYYQNTMQQAAAFVTLNDAFAFLGVTAPPRQFLDVFEFIDEFLSLKLNPAKKNYLTVTIDSGFYLVVNLKVI